MCCVDFLFRNWQIYIKLTIRIILHVFENVFSRFTRHGWGAWVSKKVFSAWILAFYFTSVLTYHAYMSYKTFSTLCPVLEFIINFKLNHHSQLHQVIICSMNTWVKLKEIKLQKEITNLWLKHHSTSMLTSFWLTRYLAFIFILNLPAYFSLEQSYFFI